MPYHHLTQQDRDRVEAMLRAGHDHREIAQVLKVHPATISREIKKRRRKDGRYDASLAEMKANVRRLRSKHQGMKIEGSAELKAHVIAELRKKRSPDEIAGRMRRDGKTFYASKNAIYHWLYSAYGQQYCQYLCTRRWRKRKQKRKTGRQMIPNRKSIGMRPLGATNKTRYRHFEADTAVAPKRAGNTDAVAFATEMKTRFILGQKIPSLAPGRMAEAMRRFAERVNMASVTIDNGIENRHHEGWGMPGFFADPHAPWQKPLIENSIGLLRRWRFPKGTDWSKVSEADLEEALAYLNNKYRKSLGYESALEAAETHGIMKKKSLRRNCT